MFRVSRRIAALGTALALSSLAALPAMADDSGLSLEITAPDEFTPGQEQAVSVRAESATPVAADAVVALTIELPSRLTAVSVDAEGFTCSITPDRPSDVVCWGTSFVQSGTVDLTVTARPGDVQNASITAQMQVDDVSTLVTKDVIVAGTPSGLDISMVLPDRVLTGQKFAVVLTGHTDTPVKDGQVDLNLVLSSDRLVATSVTAPGFECEVRPLEKLPDGGVNPGGANCTATTLADSVTMTVNVTVEPGDTALDLLRATMRVGDSSADASESIIVFGEDTTTITGRVWHDLDHDGRQDQGEPGVGDIFVVSGFDFTETKPDGTYQLRHVVLGEDRGVSFSAPNTFDFTTPNVGDDQHDSDVTTSARECEDCVVGFVPLTVTGPLTAVDAGLVDGSEVPPTSGPTATPGPSPQAAPSRDQLANTGAPAATIGAAGLLLLVAGATLVIAERRRRAPSRP